MLEVVANWQNTPYYACLRQLTENRGKQQQMVEIVATNLLARTAAIINTFLAGNSSQLVVTADEKSAQLMYHNLSGVLGEDNVYL